MPYFLEISWYTKSYLKVIHLHLSQFVCDHSALYWDGPLNWDKGCCSNIALLLRMLRVVVCFHSRCLRICKHSLFTANRWAKRPWNMPYTRMFTNSKASAMESDNSQLTQYLSNVWQEPLTKFFRMAQYIWSSVVLLTYSYYHVQLCLIVGGDLLLFELGGNIPCSLNSFWRLLTRSDHLGFLVNFLIPLDKSDFHKPGAETSGCQAIRCTLWSSTYSPQTSQTPGLLFLHFEWIFSTNFPYASFPWCLNKCFLQYRRK